MKLLKNKKNLFKGILFFMTAILVISVVDTICKFFTKELHAIQIVWGYFIGINLTLWVFFFLKGEKLSKLMKTNKPILQILRPAFLVFSISSLFVGLTYLPLAKAAAFDGEKRRGQAEIKSSLKSQLINYPKCPYCETDLVFENCHVDHIYPANRRGLTIPDNMVLICSPCNLSKSADSLRNFAKRNNLDYDKIITKLEVMGKHI